MLMPNGPSELTTTTWGLTGDPDHGPTAPNLPARTQDAVTAALKANNFGPASGSSWDALASALYDNIRPGVSWLLGTLEKLAQGLLGDVTAIFNNLGALAEALAAGVHVPITEHTEAIANLNEIAAAQKVTQAFVGDLQDMVTAPRSQLVCWGGAGSAAFDVLGTAIVAFAGGYRINCLPVLFPAVTPITNTGAIYYTPIIVDRVGTVGKLRWIVGADTSIFSIDYYEVALCAYNPVTGNVEKVWGSGDIKDAEAATTTLTEIEVDMGLTQQVSPGQILFVAHQQIAPGLLQQARAFAAVPQGNIGRPSTTLLDGACYVAPAYSQGIPSSIALSALARDNRFLPWMAVTVAAS